MPLITNDKTFWKRLKGEIKVSLPLFIFLWFVNLLIWLEFIWIKVSLLHLGLLSFASALCIFTFLDIFVQLPNTKIPDTYSPVAKRSMYIIQFLVACLALYIVIFKIVFIS